MHFSKLKASTSGMLKFEHRRHVAIERSYFSEFPSHRHGELLNKQTERSQHKTKPTF